MLRVALVALGAALAAPQAMAQTGVPACDLYLAKWDDCNERIPEVSQEDFMTINGKMREFITDQVRNGGPNERRGAEQFCKMQMAQSRKSKLFYEYGCRF
jgi:hypothetical protein